MATAFVVAFLAGSGAAAPPLPSSRQKTYMQWGQEMFVHFSITTFTGSQDGDQDARLFAPDNATLNVSQWVEAAVKGGFPVATLTAKHEAGFAIWPTKFNANYSIAMSPTVGHRDLVREFVDACRAQGVLPGLYFTTGARECDLACQQGQMTELASNYGDIHYWWFDHHNNDPVHEMMDKVVAAHSPDAARLGPDSWVTADESGYAKYPLFNQCNTTDGTIYARCPGPPDSGGSEHGTVFKAWECSCSIYHNCHPWFPNTNGHTPPAGLGELMGKYESSWGRGTNLILNLPPEKSGLIAPDVVAAAEEFAAERDRRYTRSVIASGNATLSAGGDGLVVDLASPARVDRVLLEETALFDRGQMVAGYALDWAASAGAPWTPLELNDSGNGTCPEMTYARCGGGTIGLRHIDVLKPAVTTSRIRLRLTATITPGDAVPVAVKVMSTAA